MSETKIYWVEKECGDDGLKYIVFTEETLSKRKEEYREKILNSFEPYFTKIFTWETFKKEFQKELYGNADINLTKAIDKAKKLFKKN